MNSFEIFHRYEKTWWNLQNLPWDRFGEHSVTDGDVTLAQAAVLGEATFLPGMHSFLNGGVDDYDLSAFISIWAYQELQHHFAFRTWLDRAGADFGQEAVEGTRPPFPEGHTLAQTLCSNMIGEFVVCHIYAALAKKAEDPVLSLIFENASADEGRHARAFSNYTKIELERHPEAVVSVLETLYFYAGDRRKPVNHPSHVFKQDIPSGSDDPMSMNEGFDLYYKHIDMERLRNRVYGAVGALTNYDLGTPRAIRRAIADSIEKYPQ